LLDNSSLTALIWILPILLLIIQTIFFIRGLKSVFYGYLAITIAGALWVGSFFSFCIATYFAVLPGVLAWVFSSFLAVFSGWHLSKKYRSLRWEAIEKNWRRVVDFNTFQFDFAAFNVLGVEYFDESSARKKRDRWLNVVFSFLGYGLNIFLAVAMVAGRLSVKAGIPDFRLLLLAFLFGPIIVNGIGGYLLLPGWANLRSVVRLEREGRIISIENRAAILHLTWSL
jgi:hypothetical protein